MKLALKVGVIAVLAFLATALVLPSMAVADCSDSKVKRLANQGETVRSIAQSCDLTTDEVNGILEEEADDSGEESGGGLPSGTPVGQCGCWGYIDPGNRQRQPQCESGYAQPSMCPGFCPAGGSPWRGVCT